MKQYQQEFIRLAIEAGALGFGEFRLKSGRISPYFFNAGLFHSGVSAARVGRAYADALYESGLAFNMLYGPAYKGIPLVTLTAAALAERHGLDVPFCFNRKEAKTHGEGGALIGAPVAGRVVIVDDVITAGTAIRESVSVIRAAGGEPAGVLLALDREERGQDRLSAVQEVEQEFGIPVISIVRLADLVEHLEAVGAAELEAIREYRRRYGIKVESLDVDH